MTPKIAILCGGLSHERDISLQSGHRVAGFLEESQQWDISIHDIDSSLIVFLSDSETRPDIVWPLLHGAYGEDGSTRDILEMLDLPYIGSRAKPSALAWNKPIAKNVVRTIGHLNTPDCVALPQTMFRELGVQAIINLITSRFNLPVVIKPEVGGSALGCTVVYETSALSQALIDCFAYAHTALIEQYIDGVETSVSIIEIDEEIITLPPLEITNLRGAYDYSERYDPSSSEFIVPARLDDTILENVSQAALTAFQTLGLRDICRVDFIVDKEGKPQFLEANVTPGMTDVSILPRQAMAAGWHLSELYSRIAQSALSQKRNHR